MSRLYSRARILGHQRGKRNTYPKCSLVQIEGVANKDEAKFYLGKRIAYVYRGERVRTGEKSKVRVIWGKVTRVHGNGGVVRTTFKHNLPPHSFGAMARVMLYPSNI
ncbi:60s ribosomal protein l33-a [Atractiella rhizophila]|nr:60s ribosomal protein l33-a [Atractiella rhizophila]